ncbi:MAG: hypothetical protein CVU54_15710 [Deltaproteobacteria bacterium HGW-Deltaproteobacteria-12]|jgi:polysaccharide pyruvyl transferase WcaK-like protein|nr:MAG: hypothetical protein CVU54_15710 [Deltaproteobacteria bacterium HGW-Deltaproteobacteria-12]
MSAYKKNKTAALKNANRPFRVCLLGAPFNTNNRGVSALAYSLIKLVKDVVPEAKISFFMGHPEKTNERLFLAGEEVDVKIINLRLTPKALIQEHVLFLFFMACITFVIPLRWIKKKIIHSNARLRELYDCDVIGDIHGGDSFSDIYGLGQFISGIIPTIIIILLGKKLVLFPQTYGPYNSWVAKAIARWIILRADTVLSRDRDSIELVRNMLGQKKENKQIEFCPDVAFTMPAIIPSKIEIYPPSNFTPGEAFIGLNINGLMFHGGYTGKNMFGLNFEYKTFVLKLIERLMQETTSRIFLIPHTFGKSGNVYNDNETSRQVYESLKGKYADRLYLVTGEYNQFEIKGIIGRCNFFIGSRMHACIAAVSQEVPTAAVAYSKKFSGLFDGVGLGQMVVDARTLDLDGAINRVMELYRNREHERAPIAQKINFARTQVKKTFTQLLRKPISSDSAS